MGPLSSPLVACGEENRFRVWPNGLDLPRDNGDSVAVMVVAGWPPMPGLRWAGSEGAPIAGCWEIQVRVVESYGLRGEISPPAEGERKRPGGLRDVSALLSGGRS